MKITSTALCGSDLHGKGAERVIAVDYFDYRLNHSKKMNQTEIFDFTQFDDMGETLSELTKGGADVVIDCVGMDGKKVTTRVCREKVKITRWNDRTNSNGNESGTKMWDCSTDWSVWWFV